MHKMRFPIVRVALMAIALAVVAVLVGRGADNTAEATDFDPSFSITVADPTPSNPGNPDKAVHSDLQTVFALDAPDSFPQDNPPTVNFFPPEWGLAEAGDAPLGALASEFFTRNGITLFSGPCGNRINLRFDMLVSTVDIDKTVSGGGFDIPDAPGGAGFSGQFADDPAAPGLQAGVTHFPDFLIDIFNLEEPPEGIGAPRARLFGWEQVGFSPVSLNFLTFDPGQLPGFPASRGYPTAVVLLNPQAVDVIQFNVTPDVCTPLTVVNTAFGETKDNRNTAADESGFPIFTNPSDDSVPYAFGLHAESGPDADDDGIENLLDTCPFDPNQEMTRKSNGSFFPDSDGDRLDAACDPDPTTASPPNFLGAGDEDQDNYINDGDNCPLDQNGIELLGFTFGDPPFVIIPTLGDVIGAPEQLDSDDDGIGDACDPDPFTTTGHVHVVDFSTDVFLGNHGVKLNNLAGARNMHKDVTKTYTVNVTNASEVDSQDIRVGLKGAPVSCVELNGLRNKFLGLRSTISAVPPGGEASFDVDVSLRDSTFCRSLSEITLTADACHPGDLDAGLFGRGDCGGEDPHGVGDSNPDDDAPQSIDVKLKD